VRPDSRDTSGGCVSALFIATASFFLGTGRRIPESLHIRAFRLIPLVVLVTMVFWLWRLRRRPVSQSVVTVGVPELVALRTE
jgi:hypothetical protein